MRKTRKFLAVSLALALTAGTTFSAVGCKSTEELVKDGKTINVKLNSAGYGTEYIKAVKEKFEEAFADEGYKLNVFSAKAGLTNEKVTQDIATGAGADVYFSSGVTQEILEQDVYEDTLADITELVANKKPIGFNGEEVGEKTIAEIMAEDTYGYTSTQKSDGSWYSVPWAAGQRGLVVNTGVLAEYKLEIPKTSKEFFHCYDVIQAERKDKTVAPLVQITDDNNYPVSFTMGWLAQYEGMDWYNQFFSFEKADGTKLTADEAKGMYEAKGMGVMFENMFRALDKFASVKGAASVEKAQSSIMNGDCAFMMNGDWMLSETYESFTDAERANIAFARVPIISELGVKLFGAGTSYNKSEEDCEKILRAIIDEVDLDKDIADIKTAVDAKFGDIKAEDIQTVAKARGYTYVESVQSGIYINEQSEVKDLAALLVRFCCSPEGGALIATKTHGGNPFAQSYEKSMYEFVNQARSYQASKYFQGFRTEPKGYRTQVDKDFLDIFPSFGSKIHSKIVGKEITIYNPNTYKKVAELSLYTTEAQAFHKDICDKVKTYTKW